MLKATLIKGKTFSCGKYRFDSRDLKSQIIEENFVGLLEKSNRFKIVEIGNIDIIKPKITESGILKSEVVSPNRTGEPKIFILIDWIEEATGYGNIAKKLLKKYSGTIKYVQKGPEFKDNLDLKDVPLESYVIQLTTPNCFRDLSNVKKRIGFTMFETTKIPKDWPKICNKLCDILIVPSKENKKIFKNCGVNVPIKVIPLWADNCYKYYKRPVRKIFNFLFAGSVDTFNRKGWYELVKAFKQEFKEDKDVRLTIKCQHPQINNVMYEQIISDNRIKFIKGTLSNKELNELYGNADCFVFPTKGEGFGLNPLEAMATGLPVIVTNWMGCKEFVDNKICYPLKVDKLEEALYPDTYGDVGDWAYISTKELRKQMRYVYEHQKEAKQKGKLAAKVVDEKFRFKNFTESLEKIIGKDRLINKDIFKIRNPKNKSLGEIGVYIRMTDYYAGGRIYFRDLIRALNELGEDIIVYTDTAHDSKTFNYNDIGYVVSQDIPDVDRYLIIIGETNKSIPAALRYKKPYTFVIFDALPNLLKMGVDEYNYKEEQEKYYNNHEAFLTDDRANIVTISEFAQSGIKKWVNKDSKVIYPCIHSNIIQKAKQKKVENWITIVSRIDKIKQPMKFLDIYEYFKYDYELHVVTSFINGIFERQFRKRANELNVKIHFQASEIEKYEIIKQSKITINTAAEEGFGMYIAESQACGVPFVGYDLPTSLEIQKIQPQGLYLAKNDEDFISKMKIALEADRFKPICNFTFEDFKEQVKQVML